MVLLTINFLKMKIQKKKIITMLLKESLRLIKNKKEQGLKH